MSRRKKKHHHEDHVDESWLIPYADLLTLLLALFIVLFSMSSINAQKFNAMSKAFNQIFTGGEGVLEFPSPVLEKVTQAEKEDKEEESTQEEMDQDHKELEDIQGKVNQYIRDNKLQNKLGTELTDEGLLVRIRDNVLFDSGKAEIRKKDLKVANEISGLLIMNPPRNIIISGHTDNVPINNSKYESNWDLSTMRATSFLKVLLNNDKLDPRLFRATGFGEYQPVASNNTKEGKAKNRRVEILILPRYQD
ncbi:flagellar motor protein MotB [Bacillus sp. CGMCC 1.16607]|uniref:flagellar motor protein MotB n=1 Tax=Bacillus sp. CGMCC 1.16607 TaxID=3351842 RepID=UPI003630AF60